MLAHYTDTQTKIAKRSEWNPKEKTQKIFLNFRSFLISKLLSFPIIFQLIEVKFVCHTMACHAIICFVTHANQTKPNQIILNQKLFTECVCMCANALYIDVNGVDGANL